MGIFFSKHKSVSEEEYYEATRPGGRIFRISKLLIDKNEKLLENDNGDPIKFSQVFKDKTHDEIYNFYTKPMTKNNGLSIADFLTNYLEFIIDYHLFIEKDRGNKCELMHPAIQNWIMVNNKLLQFPKYFNDTLLRQILELTQTNEILSVCSKRTQNTTMIH